MNFLGKVVKGTGLGYKTANLMVEDRRCLEGLSDGVYLAKVSYRNREYPALGVKGMRKDFEVRLLGFEGDLYGQTLAVELGKKMRDLIEFKDDQSLLRQIKEDIRRAEQYFKLK